MGFGLFFFWLSCAFYASYAAKDKGHNSIVWFIGGFVFGPVALIAASGLSDLRQRRYLRLLAESQGIDLKSSQSSDDPEEDLTQKMQGH